MQKKLILDPSKDQLQSTHIGSHTIQSKEVIDLDDQEVQIQESEPLRASLDCHFGQFTLSLQQNMLKIELQFKQAQNNNLLQDDQIQIIQRQEYQMTQPIQLQITNQQLSPYLKQAFSNVRKLAKYLIQNIDSPAVIAVDSERLCLKLPVNNVAKTVDLYYNFYKKIEKEQLIRDMKKFKDTFSMITQADMELIDPQLLTTAVALSNEDLLDIYRQGDSSSSFTDDEEQSNEQSNDGDTEQQKLEVHLQKSSGKGYAFNQHMDNRSQDQADNFQARMSSFRKQNQIPIYERFKGVDINMPRKQKIKLAQKMLRIGYSKEQIIRFFGGGAEEMELEGRRIPDYRNPNSLRYKEIHIIVAKKQHERFTKLLKRHGLPLVQELPQYSTEIMRNSQKTVRDLLIKFIKQKRFRKLDQIQGEMERRGVYCSLVTLKKMVQELKRRNMERRQQQEQAKTMENTAQASLLPNDNVGQSKELE